MPIVNLFQKKVFKMGESIIRQGQTIKEIAVLAEGKCKVVYETLHSRQIEPSYKVRGLIRPMRNLDQSYKQ